MRPRPDAAVTPPRLSVLFAPAAGRQIGGGHVMRDLALAEALAARGALCTFAASRWGARLLERFAQPRPAIAPLARSGDPAEIVRALAAVGPDVLVLDDYSLDGAAAARLRQGGLKIAVIDDLADRAQACDLLVDPGYGREVGDYAALTPAGCQVLVGPRHALVRHAFAEAARRPPRPLAAAVARVFVSFGLSDVEGVTARAVARLRPLAPHARFDVALASDAPSLAALRALASADAGLVLHPDARDIAGLMQAADVAVGAGGSATWERCALGLPTLAVIVAENQRAVLGRLADRGAVLCVDLADPAFPDALDDAFHRLCVLDVRQGLRAASLGLCDGQGAGRVADALFAMAAAP